MILLLLIKLKVKAIKIKRIFNTQMQKSVSIENLKLVKDHDGTLFKGNAYMDGFNEAIEVVFPPVASQVTEYQYECLERINLEWPTIFKQAQEFPKAPKGLSKAKVVCIMVVDEYDEDPHIEIVLVYKKWLLWLPYIYSIILEDFKITNIIDI